MPGPIIGVLLGYVWLKGTAVGQAGYIAGKLWIAVLPIVWWLLVIRRPVRWVGPTRRGMGMGVALGLVIAVLIAGGYAVAGRWFVDPAMLRDHLEASGLSNPWVYAGFGLAVASSNALLEEYAWRWFLYGRCEALVTGQDPWLLRDAGPVPLVWPAILLAASLFTVHHVIVLRVQFGWTATILASAGVFIGGVVWAVLMLRTRSIWPSYVSHLIVNLAMFAVGGWIVWGS
jgi:membrane protease YdiL (CAAX protease family)